MISAMTGDPPLVPSDQEPVSMLTEKQSHPDFIKTRFYTVVSQSALSMKNSYAVYSLHLIFLLNCS